MVNKMENTIIQKLQKQITESIVNVFIKSPLFCMKNCSQFFCKNMNSEGGVFKSVRNSVPDFGRHVTNAAFHSIWSWIDNIHQHIVFAS